MTRVQSHDPAHPTRIVGDVGALDARATDRLVERARTAAWSWATDATARVAALGAWASAIEAESGDLATLVAREVGKPITEARGEVARTVAILRYYAQHALDDVGVAYPTTADARLWVERRPRGLVLAMTPWNFPLAIPMWKVAPALACGNAVVLRPSSAAIGTAERLVALAHDRLPDGVLTLLPIGHDLTSDLLASGRLDAVSFTGSVEVGRALSGIAASAGVPVQAELGGQNASIVLGDADPGPVATMVVGAAMAYAGQKCTATSRIIVTRDIAGPFIEALVGTVADLSVGDPLSDATVVGPVISAASRAAFDAAVVAAPAGSRVLAVAQAPEAEGHFVTPTLVQVLDDRSHLMQEEVFGPVAAVMVVADDDEAVSVANGTRFGLVAAVYARDQGRGERVADRLDVGMIRINAPTTGVDYHAPFGGERESSYGPREQGPDARAFYTTTRTVLSRRG